MQGGPWWATALSDGESPSVLLRVSRHTLRRPSHLSLRTKRPVSLGVTSSDCSALSAPYLSPPPVTDLYLSWHSARFGPRNWELFLCPPRPCRQLRFLRYGPYITQCPSTPRAGCTHPPSISTSWSTTTYRDLRDNHRLRRIHGEDSTPEGTQADSSLLSASLSRLDSPNPVSPHG